jgi:radical SAM protein with 4Fe4S-binding SPASM domain
MKNNEKKGKRATVMLALSEACNLSCSYCYETQKNAAIMPFEVATEAIAKYAESFSDAEEFGVDFHGGEPFLHFALIKAICEWVWAKKWNKPHICFTSTNGTLVHGEIKEWLTVNKERFVAGLSLDGTPEMHNANRSGSYASIDTDFFVSTWPFQGVKMTISPATVNNVCEGVMHLHKLGFDVSANAAYGVAWDKKEYFRACLSELGKLADFYLKNPSIKPASILNMDLSVVAYPDRPLSKWCGTGTSMIAVMPDGKAYPCQFFAPSTGLDRADIDFNDTEALYTQECKDCLIGSVCPSCYGANLASTGNIAEKGEAYCKFSKIRAWVCSYMYGYMLLDPSRYIPTQERQANERSALACGVKAVQERFQEDIAQIMDI